MMRWRRSDGTRKHCYVIRTSASSHIIDHFAGYAKWYFAEAHASSLLLQFGR